MRIEAELDDAEKTIGERLHVIDLDNDGLISESELQEALRFLKANLDEEELLLLLDRCGVWGGWVGGWVEGVGAARCFGSVWGVVGPLSFALPSLVFCFCLCLCRFIYPHSCKRILPLASSHHSRHYVRKPPTPPTSPDRLNIKASGGKDQPLISVKELIKLAEAATTPSSSSSSSTTAAAAPASKAAAAEQAPAAAADTVKIHTR